MIERTMAELKFSQKYKVIVILMEYSGWQRSPNPMRPIEEGDKLRIQGTIDDIEALVGTV